MDEVLQLNLILFIKTYEHIINLYKTLKYNCLVFFLSIFKY